MKEVLDFLNKAKTFYLATTDGEKAYVRPLGLVIEYNGKLAFSTNNQKPMYKQMQSHPDVQICAYDGEGNTLRISGKFVVVTTEEAQAKALDLFPNLKNMYSPGDGLFEIFSLDDASAICTTMSGESKELPL